MLHAMKSKLATVKGKKAKSAFLPFTVANLRFQPSC